MSKMTNSLIFDRAARVESERDRDRDRGWQQGFALKRHFGSGSKRGALSLCVLNIWDIAR